MHENTLKINGKPRNPNTPKFFSDYVPVWQVQFQARGMQEGSTSYVNHYFMHGVVKQKLTNLTRMTTLRLKYRFSNDLEVTSRLLRLSFLATFMRLF